MSNEVDSADVLQAHASQHKISPSQQVNLLVHYVSLAQMFPEITLAQYLDRTLLVAGATKENRQFPKDALDYHCPNKSSQWEPRERVDLLLIYVEMSNIMRREAPDEPIPSLDAFLAQEAIVYRQTPAAPAAYDGPAAPPATAETTAKKTRQRKPKAPVEHIWVAPSRATYRVVLAGGLAGPVHEGTITELYTGTDGVKLAVFTTDVGEVLRDCLLAHCAPLDVPAPLPPSVVASRQAIRLNKEDFAKVMSLLASPSPIGNVALGEQLMHFPISFGDAGSAAVSVVNSQPRPYVDAYFVRPDGEVIEQPPREGGIEGTYTFTVGETHYQLEVTGNK